MIYERCKQMFKAEELGTPTQTSNFTNMLLNRHNYK